MQIMFYSSVPGITETRMLSELEIVAPEGELQIFRDVLEFRQALQNLLDYPAIGILLFGERTKLEEIIKFESWLRKLYLVIVAPSQDRDIVALAHKLRPRYLSYIDSDYSQVGAVLSRLIENMMESSWTTVH